MVYAIVIEYLFKIPLLLLSDQKQHTHNKTHSKYVNSVDVYIPILKSSESILLQSFTVIKFSRLILFEQYISMLTEYETKAVIHMKPNLIKLNIQSPSNRD